MSDETPQHHEPIVHGLHLATHAGVADAWEEFFLLVFHYGDVLKQRRAAKLEEQGRTNTEPAAQNEHT